jgi:prolipoprotein diacylglyceryltransferase
MEKLYRGTIIGVFFIVLFGMRFLIEFIKEPQVGFEETMLLNMGQLLSIPFILIGVVFLIYGLKKKQPFQAVHPTGFRPSK